MCASIRNFEDTAREELIQLTDSNKSQVEILTGVLESNAKSDTRRVLSLQKVLYWTIQHCDTVPNRIINEPFMRKYVWSVLGCREGLPNEETFKDLVDSIHREVVIERNDILNSTNACQISVNLKSYRDRSTRAVQQVMATTFRLYDGKVFGGICCCKSAHGNKLEMLESLILANSRNLIDSQRVNGYVVDSSCSSELCEKIEESIPSVVAFPCQSYALKKLLNTIIQKDIYLQQMLQDCSKLYDQAEKKNLCSADLLCHVRSWTDVMRGTEARATSKLQLTPYILCIDKLRNDWGLSSFSHKLGFVPENEHFWTQLASYAKLLEPLVQCVAYLETSQPSLGQMHLIWHCMLRHADLWCDLVEKEKEKSSYSMNCFSTENIKKYFYDYRAKYYHPAFTLGYLLDCRLWSVSLGIARPNTGRLSYEEINEARTLASRISNHPIDVNKELTHLVQYGVKDDAIDILKNMPTSIHSGWAISDDTCPSQAHLLNQVWGISTFGSKLKHEFPRLSALFRSISIMKGTAERSRSIPSVLKWLVKHRDERLSFEMRTKIGNIALSSRILPNSEDTSTFLSYFGLQSSEVEETWRAMNQAQGSTSDKDAKKTTFIGDETCQTPSGSGLAKIGYELSESRYTDSTPTQRATTMLTEHQDSPLLQLTDQTNKISTTWLANRSFAAREPPQEVSRISISCDGTEVNNGAKKSIGLVRKSLLGDFDLSPGPEKRPRMTP